MGKFGRATASITGSASGFSSTEVFPQSTQSHGRILGVDIRLAVAPNENASAIVAYGVCNGDDLGDAPGQRYIVFETASIALTTHATTASLATMFDNPSDFYDGLRVGGSVTATGAYSIEFTVHYELKD